MNKYKASWIASIELLPIESETKSRVIIGFDKLLNKEISYSKETRSEKFCDTFEEAKTFLVEKHKRNIAELEHTLRVVKEDLARAENLTYADVRKYQ